MSDRKRSLLGLGGRERLSIRRGSMAVRAVPAVAAVGVMFLASVASAGAATTSPIGLTGAPDPLTVCSGNIARDSSGVNQLDYSFSCAPLTTAGGQTGNILSYTIEAIRPQDDLNNIQNFSVPSAFYALDNPDATGYSATATGPSTTVDSLASDISCEGGAGQGVDGVDCYEGEPSSSADGYVPSGDYVEGSINLGEPFCSYLPEGAKPGTPAVPQAEIELVVTDSTGAEDGPFELDLAKNCAKVPAVVPAFTLSSVKSAGRSVTISADLPFTGKLAVELLDGRTVVGSASEKLSTSGDAKLTTKLNGAGAKLAAKAGKSGLSISVKATYTPTAGKAEVATKSGVTLK